MASEALVQNDTSDRLQARLERERSARQEAERLLEEKSRSLYTANAELARLHAQEKQSGIRLSGILNGMPVGVMTTDRQCAVIDINNAAQGYFRTTLAAATKQPIGHFLPKFSHLSDAAAAAAKIVETPGEYTQARRSDGGEFPCEIAINHLAGAEDNIFIWIVRDVTQRAEIEKRKQELEDELRQVHRLESLGTMAGGIAHELNTPIQFVSDNMRFLGEAFADIQKALSAYAALAPAEAAARVLEENDLEFLAGEIPAAIRQSEEGLARVAEIVLAIKRFSHPAGDAKENNDLNQIIVTTATVSKNQWKYVADLDLDLDPNLPPVKSNAGELNQVLINLIVNAAHAIEDRGDKAHKGKITITTRLVGNAVACSVADTGMGIPAKNRDRIFDLFFTTKAPGRGTGQGLSLVHNIILHHGGRITVDSDVGRGSRFIFILPLEPSAVQTMKAE